MRIGVFGGSFNPPHMGHLNIAKKAAELAELEKVIVMPACTPPHKSAATLATDRDRLNMARLAFSDGLFQVSDLEMKRGGKSYTVDTLTELKELYPEDELVFIVGSDMLLCFDKWYRYRDILSMCTLCAFSRKADVPASELKNYAENVLGLSADRGEILIFDIEVTELSSTEVRAAVTEGKDPRNLVDDRVLRYIREKKPYTQDIDRVDEFKELIGSMLREDRYLHSLAVADSAVALAKKYGADEAAAYCAGLLHDVTKHLSDDKQLQILEKAGIILTSAELANKSLWHAMSAAAFLSEELNVKNPELISAVRYHTTGRAGMTLLEKTVYIADFISADRSYPDVEVMRSLANRDLNEAALYSLDFCIGRLLRENKVIHTNSVDFYNELITERADKNDGK